MTSIYGTTEDDRAEMRLDDRMEDDEPLEDELKAFQVIVTRTVSDTVVVLAHNEHSVYLWLESERWIGNHMLVLDSESVIEDIQFTVQDSDIDFVDFDDEWINDDGVRTER